jgi:malonyl-CoA O-methyltransferase
MTDSPPTLDPLAALHWAQVAPPESPWLHEEIASRMLDRLQWVKLQPQAWANWGALRGGLKAHALLLKKYPKALSFVAETNPRFVPVARAKTHQPWWRLARWQQTVRHGLPPPASVDMLWANMALHEAADPKALLAQWHQALATNGFLMFSCLGPDSAIELRELYAELGWPPAGHDLTDMHDWGDMLVQTGFAEPVMDMERITLTYETPARLLEELVAIGRNYHPARFAGLRSRQWKKSLERVMDERLPRDAQGRLCLSFEIIYGHALKPLPRVKLSALSSVSMQDMRSMLKGSGAA